MIQFKKIINGLDISKLIIIVIQLVILFYLIKPNDNNQINIPIESQYRDSLMIERYKVKVLEHYLIDNKIKNYEDSIALTNRDIKFFIRYIANMGSSDNKGR